MSVIYQNLLFHNVEQLIPYENGVMIQRLPDEINEHMNDTLRNKISHLCTGVEIRFLIKSGKSASIYLKNIQEDEVVKAQVAYIYYGGFQGGWDRSSVVLHNSVTEVTLSYPDNIEKLEEISKKTKQVFSPRVIRLVLPYGYICFLGVRGDVSPPDKAMMPNRSFLSYGSSITNGSIALAPPYSYPFRLAQKLQYDYLNYGFAGCAYIEEKMASYIVSRKDWEFATFEIGINMLKKEFTEEVFTNRLIRFLAILSKDQRTKFVTSIYGFNGDKQEKANRFRKIIKEYVKPPFIFIDGLDLLNNPAYISQDMLHPSLEGMDELTNRWYQLISKVINPQEIYNCI